MPSITPDTGRSQHNTLHQSLTCIQHLSSLDESGQDPERARMENLNYLLSKVFDGWRMATNKVLITEPSPSPVDTLQCPLVSPSPGHLPIINGVRLVTRLLLLQRRRTNVNVLVPVSQPVQCPRPCAGTVRQRDNSHRLDKQSPHQASRAKIAHRQLVIELG